MLHIGKREILYISSDVGLHKVSGEHVSDHVGKPVATERDSVLCLDQLVGEVLVRDDLVLSNA